MTEGMGRTGGMESRLRIIAVSALAAFFAPLVFVGIIVLRKAERRFNFHARVWNKRLQHEIARWS
ncbi:MAG: hypothetical protein ABSB68_04815 [Acidimicrobiales bacterium]